MASRQAFDLFFDFPGEIREHILGYLLIKPQGILISQDPTDCRLIGTGLSSQVSDKELGREAQDEDEHDSPYWPLNYFLVSQTFHREATAVYFRDNAFHIITKGTRLLFNNSDRLRNSNDRFSLLNLKAPRSGDALLVNPAWALSRRRLRKVVIYVQRPRGVLEDSVFQPLLDMILAGGLKELEFRVAFKARGHGVLGGDLMQGMYRVLTDPDLVTAKISIPFQDHGSGWCPFHARSDGRPLCLGSAWMDVDVAALIRRYGRVEDQLRILKVGN